MKYEIINPSDKCYITSDTPNVAKFCCLLLGGGFYGLKEAESGMAVMGINVFRPSKENLDAEVGEDINHFAQNHCSEIIACLDSFEYDCCPTSINDIRKTAKKWADAMRGIK